MQFDNVRNKSSVDEHKEKIAAALAKLKSSKCRVSELRAHCEALKLQSEQRDLICNECNKLIEQGQEVTLKDSLGKIKKYYHRDCFRAIWLSQTWIFDYSFPGFLRISENYQ